MSATSSTPRNTISPVRLPPRSSSDSGGTAGVVMVDCVGGSCAYVGATVVCGSDGSGGAVARTGWPARYRSMSARIAAADWYLSSTRLARDFITMVSISGVSEVSWSDGGTAGSRTCW